MATLTAIIYGTFGTVCRVEHKVEVWDYRIVECDPKVTPLRMRWTRETDSHGRTILRPHWEQDGVTGK